MARSSSPLTPEQRSLRARMAAHESWAQTPDRTARTAPATRANPGSIEYWLAKVDPDQQMTPEARQAAAESKRKAHMTRLSLKASQARARKAEGGANAA